MTVKPVVLGTFLRCSILPRTVQVDGRRDVSGNVTVSVVDGCTALGEESRQTRLVFHGILRGSRPAVQVRLRSLGTRLQGRIVRKRIERSIESGSRICSGHGLVSSREAWVSPKSVRKDRWSWVRVARGVVYALRSASSTLEACSFALPRQSHSLRAGARVSG